MDRNPYIRRRTFWTFFVASVLTSLIDQINRLSDGIILSHLVSPDALSAIGLLTPVQMFVFVFATTVCNGASVLVAKMIGAQKYSDASRMMVVIGVILMVVYAIVGIILSFCSDTISGWLTSDSDLIPLLKEYFPVSMISLPFLTLNAILCFFVKAAGKPGIVTKSVLILCGGNILLDLLFVGVFKMGIAGAAWASIASLILASVYLFLYFLSKDCLYHLHIPGKSDFKSMFSDSFKMGLPTGTSILASSVVMMGLNSLVQKVTGSDGLFVFSVGMQMLAVCMLVLAGTSSAITTIGGILIGEKDLEGYRSLVTGILRISFLTILGLSIIMASFPGAIGQVFGASGEMLENVTAPLSDFAMILAPIALFSLLSGAYIIQGHKLLSAVTNLLPFLSIFLILLTASLFFPQYFWLSLPVGIWMALGIFVFCMHIRFKRRKDLNWLTLVPKFPNNPSVSMSVPYTSGSMDEMLEKVRQFISICELPSETVDRVRHSIEELSYHIIGMNTATQKKGFFDVRVVWSPNELMIVLKDANRPYNPICTFNPESGLTPEEENIGLALANTQCQDITHAFMNGINCTYLKFPY